MTPSETTTPLTLASGSPRRAALLRAAGLDFTVTLPEVVEIERSFHPEYTPVVNAVAKAEDVAARVPLDRLTLAADTVVLLDDAIIGKPADADHAVRMLETLSGRRHAVLTSVCLRRPAKAVRCVFTEVSLVTIRHLTLDEIKSYVATVNPLDRAGSYGAQDDQFHLVERVEGEFENVVGLPLRRTLEAIRLVGRATGAG